VKRHSFLVFTSPVDGMDDEFNQWYDDQHLADVLDIPGFVSARRYRLVEPKHQADELMRWQYMAIYEIECDDISLALDEIRKRAGTTAMPISDALDKSKIATLVMQPLFREQDNHD